MPAESPAEALLLEQAAVQGVEQAAEQTAVQGPAAVQVLAVDQAGQ